MRGVKQTRTLAHVHTDRMHVSNEQTHPYAHEKKTIITIKCKNKKKKESKIGKWVIVILIRAIHNVKHIGPCMHHPTCHAMPCMFLRLCCLLLRSRSHCLARASSFARQLFVAHMMTTVGSRQSLRMHASEWTELVFWTPVCRHRDSCSVLLDWLVMRFGCSRLCVICCENKYVTRERERSDQVVSTRAMLYEFTDWQRLRVTHAMRRCVWEFACSFSNLKAPCVNTNVMEDRHSPCKSNRIEFVRDRCCKREHATHSLHTRRGKKQCINVILVALDGHSIRFPYGASCTSQVTQIGAAQQWQQNRESVILLPIVVFRPVPTQSVRSISSTDDVHLVFWFTLLNENRCQPDDNLDISLIFSIQATRAAAQPC